MQTHYISVSSCFYLPPFHTPHSSITEYSNNNKMKFKTYYQILFSVSIFTVSACDEPDDSTVRKGKTPKWSIACNRLQIQ